ncbi:MAG TPA: sigma-54 dependent transcriptional regulator [bacterium]|nr:sigma-54 dependent transcriptional regulator [bacterium]
MKKKILIIDDDAAVCTFLSDLLSDEYKIEAFVNPKKALEYLEKKSTDIVLLDIRMPELSGEEVLKILKEKYEYLPVVMITAIDDLKTAVRCIKLGACEYLTKPFHIEEIRHTIKHILYVIDIENQLDYYKTPNIQQPRIYEYQTNSSKMQEILKIINKIAPQDVTVLLTGESGVGKEIMANYIHNNSPRKKQAFIAIDCGAIPSTLIQSELFGYEKGAFTGAVSTKKGKLELANGGTLFLDEINNMDFDSQAKLLRVIQNRQIERLGGTSTIDIDVRLIVASNKNLWQEVENKKFREDLFYRINVIHIVLPPLRERLEDIELLTKHFIEKSSQKNRKKINGITQVAIDLLKKYDWPGNIRELENIIEKAVILTKNNILDLQDFSDLEYRLELKNILPLDKATEKFQKEYIRNIFTSSDKNIEKTSELLNITTKQLQMLLKKYEINY